MLPCIGFKISHLFVELSCFHDFIELMCISSGLPRYISLRIVAGTPCFFLSQVVVHILFMNVLCVYCIINTQIDPPWIDVHGPGV